MVKCQICGINPVCSKTPEGKLICKDCFIKRVEDIVSKCIQQFNLIQATDHIVIGVSGGKDSTALATMLYRINQQNPTGAKFSLVAVDEGIKSYCGVLRRQCLEKVAININANVIATGHNGDDVAETVLMNFLRGDSARLERSKSLLRVDEKDGNIIRIKPFSLLTQKEVVLYAHYMKLNYFSVECTYAGTAFRGNARMFLQEAQLLYPSIIANCVVSNEQVHVSVKNEKVKVAKKCINCGMQTSSEECQACRMMKELKAGQPKISID
ncbi:ATP-binding domain containing protein [Entamoeba marina]